VLKKKAGIEIDLIGRYVQQPFEEHYQKDYIGGWA